MRKLAVSLNPLEWETLPSFLDRLAAHYAVPLSDVLRATGLTPGTGGRPKAYGIDLSEEQISAFSEATRLRPDETAALLLSRLMSATGADLDRPATPAEVARAGWIYVADSHACPECLRARNGAWHMWWKFPWSFLCVRHERFLLGICSRCKKRIGKRDPDGRTVLRLGYVPLPGHCSHVDPHATLEKGISPALCAHDFAADHAPHVDSEWLLTTQVRLNQALAGEPPLFAGGLVSAQQYFAELRSITALLLHAGSSGQLGGIPPIAMSAFRDHVDARETDRTDEPHKPHIRRYYAAARRDPLVMAAVLPAAVFIADAGSMQELRVRLGPLAVELQKYASRIALMQLGRHYGMTQTIEDVLHDALRSLRPKNRFATHAWHFSRQHRNLRFEPRHVPQLLWPEYWETFIHEILPTKRERPARMFASVALVRLCWQLPWGAAAAALELPPDPSRGTASDFVARLNRENKLAAFVAALGRVTDDLNRPFPGLVRHLDYGARRARLRHMTTLGPSDWSAATGNNHASDTDRHYASVWLWSELTGGDPLRAPMAPTWNRGLREAYHRFAADRLPPYGQPLTEWGHRHLIEETQ